MKGQKDPRGRKPVSDPKLPVRVFLNESIILKCGGEETLKTAIADLANRLSKKKR